MAGYDINVGRDLLPGLLSGQKRRVTGSGLALTHPSPYYQAHG